MHVRSAYVCTFRFRHPSNSIELISSTQVSAQRPHEAHGLAHGLQPLHLREQRLPGRDDFHRRVAAHQSPQPLDAERRHRPRRSAK